MPNYKLLYFNVKARGESIRLIFAEAGIEFEDKRVEPSEWPEIKPSKTNTWSRQDEQIVIEEICSF